MEQDQPTRKRCRGCERELPLEAFQKCARRGVQSRCRDCRAAAAVEYRARTQAQRSEYNPFNYHVDHIIPLARGGEHSYANVQAAHPLCNIRKGGRSP